MVQRCPGCGEENPDRFRLCGYCGSVLVVMPPPQEVRKTVTIVFCDLKDSTALGDRLDSEALREVLALYFSAMKPVLERHGGTIEKYSARTSRNASLSSRSPSSVEPFRSQNTTVTVLRTS